MMYWYTHSFWIKPDFKGFIKIKVNCVKLEEKRKRYLFNNKLNEEV